MDPFENVTPEEHRKQVEAFRRELDSYVFYFAGKGLPEEKIAKHDRAEETLTDLRKQLYSHPAIEIVEDLQFSTVQQRVGEYDRVEISVAARQPVYTEEKINTLALEIFSGFFDQQELEDTTPEALKEIGIRFPTWADLHLSEESNSYAYRNETLRGFRFPFLVKNHAMAFAEKSTSYSVVNPYGLIIPAEAMEVLLKPNPKEYQPFLWRRIVVRLFPDSRIARFHLKWIEFNRDQKVDSPTDNRRVIGIWKIPELKNTGLASIDYGIFNDIYEKWREGKDLIREYLPPSYWD